jgi:hypothetical protein
MTRRLTAGLVAGAAAALTLSAAAPAGADPGTPAGPTGPCTYTNDAFPDFTMTITNDGDAFDGESVEYRWYVDNRFFSNGFIVEPVGHLTSVVTGRGLVGSPGKEYRVEFTPNRVGSDRAVTFAVTCL